MDAVPKIEGHAAFYAHLKSGRVDKARIIGLENDRFVEHILVDRKYYEAPIITSRICGICPTIHNITSTRAIEDACGINPSVQTKILRKLMLCGQMIQSHSLHLYLLVLPDFMGIGSSFELQKEHPQLFKNAIFLKQYADRILDVVGGRAVHPISNVPGGFKQKPSLESLKTIIEDIDQIEEIARDTVILFHNFQYPAISRDLTYCALSYEDEYPIYEGDIKSTSQIKFKPKNYKNFIYEELRHYTKAKFGSFKGEGLMVGAIARININRKYLLKETHELITTLGIEKYFDNPFDNIIAQALENYEFVLKSKKIIEGLIKQGIDRKDPVKPAQNFGTGVSACEAPRGVLIHKYGLDKFGNIEDCDIVTPTVLNLNSLEMDMKNIGPIIKNKDKEDQVKTIEMLIRAYDPCITCATH